MVIRSSLLAYLSNIPFDLCILRGIGHKAGATLPVHDYHAKSNGHVIQAARRRRPVRSLEPIASTDPLH